MASQSTLESFHNSWNQTAQWAQSKGIKYNDYYPIYQQDTQRLLQYGSPMSAAERERAIEAAANVNVATQSTPSTAANPTNVIENTVTDLRNIFTGVGDIAIHPLHNGLIDSVKNTFDLLDGSHHLTGSASQQLAEALTSTVLSWVPGAADVGDFIQAGGQYKGLAALADHPVSSLLDVLPIANKAVELKVAGDAGFAERVGLKAGEGPKPSIGRVAKGYLFNTVTKKVGPEGLMSVGERFHALTAGSILNTNPAIADIAGAVENTQNHYTSIERYVYNDTDEAMKDLDDGQKAQVYDVMYSGHASNLEDRLKEVDDPAVTKAVRAMQSGPIQFAKEEILAQDDGPHLITNPYTGEVGMYTETGHAEVIRTAAAYTKTADKVNELLPGLEKIQEQTEAGNQIFQQAAAQLEQANQAARNVGVEGNVTFVAQGAKQATGIAKASIAKDWFDTGGKIDRLLAKAKDGRYQEVEELSADWLKRTEKWSPTSVDTTDPAFQAIRTQLQKIHDASRIMNEVRKQADKEAYGKAGKWVAGKGQRDEVHEAEAKQLRDMNRIERRKLRDSQTKMRNQLGRAYQIKRQEIRTRYSLAKRQADAELRDGTTEINERYGIEKAKVTTRHLLAREAHNEWLKGRRAQGLPASRDYLQAAQEGSRIAPGALGSHEAIEAGHATLEAARRQELADLVKSIPSKDALDAKMKGELRAADTLERQMTDRLQRTQDADEQVMEKRHQQAEKDLEKTQKGKRSLDGRTSKAVKAYLKAQKDFSASVWKHPSDNNSDLYMNVLAKHILKNDEIAGKVRDNESHLAEKYGLTQDHIDNLRENPQIMAALVQFGVKGAFDSPIFQDIDPKLLKAAQDSARDELIKLGKQGIHPQYVPHVSETQLRADATGSYGIRLVVGKGVPNPDALSSRVTGLDVSKYDLMAGLHRGTKQILERDAFKNLVNETLAPRVTPAETLMNTVMEFFPDQVSTLSRQGLSDFIAARAKDWNLKEFDPESSFGIKSPRFGTGKVYMDADLLKAVTKLTSEPNLLLGKTFDKATKLFRFSILGLSPRYTAHILFGGSFLLALRSTPFMPGMLTTAWKALKTGELPEDLLTSPTNLGTTDYELSSFKDASKAFGGAAGKQTARMLAQEDIEVRQGIPWKQANPLHWLKALGDLNLRFTAHVVNMQRALAYLDGAAKAERHGVTDEFGNPVEMTKERMMQEGMQHAADVMGDLRRMSPFERQVAKTAVPFYGWEKHILKYVLSFPADHPWRALMLSQMAEYDTSHTPAGLPSRYQFLFFLGTPDAQGNASVLDLRAVNPLRDVANYATLGGIISSLNPVVTAGISAVDPDIIYGGNEMYPNLTYDQFYGIEEAGPQGNLITAASQIVPQVSALQSAMKVAGARQGMNTSSLIKNIYESLNIPMLQVQHINLKQEAASTAIAQYHVTSQLAQNAWETGDFAPIADLGSVPDPRNPDYETPVSDLEQLYSQLAKDYPGQSPADTATPLPSVHL